MTVSQGPSVVRVMILVMMSLQGNPGPPGPNGSKGPAGPRGMKVSVREHTLGYDFRSSLGFLRQISPRHVIISSMFLMLVMLLTAFFLADSWIMHTKMEMI